MTFKCGFPIRNSSRNLQAFLFIRIDAGSNPLKPFRWSTPVGDIQNQPFPLSFNNLWNVNFQGLRVASDGGVILIRELDERLGFGELVEEYLTDAHAQSARPPFAELLRQSVYSRLPGYEEVNDSGRPCHDPTLWLIGSKRSAIEARL